MTELLYGRYQRIAHQRTSTLLARDVESGRRVLLPEVMFKTRWCGFLHAARLRASAPRIAAMEDLRFLPIESTSPVVVACPAFYTDDGRRPRPSGLRLSAAELVNVTLELIELSALAMRCGAHVSVWDAWIARDDSGRATVRVPAPLAPAREREQLLHALDLLRDGLSGKHHMTGLNSEDLFAGDPPSELVAVATRIAPSIDTTSDWGFVYPVQLAEAVEGLSPFAGDAARVEAALHAISALDRESPGSDFDLDLAIELGERERAQKLVDEPDDAWMHRPVRFALGAVRHRRACLAAAHGDLTTALVDARRAVELDEHPEYLTTLALLLERAGDDAAAEATHRRAVAAIDAVAPGADDEPVFVDFYDSKEGVARDIDYRASFPRMAARSLEASGAFRATHGDPDGGEADLRASLAMHATSSAERRLARLARRREEA